MRGRYASVRVRMQYTPSVLATLQLNRNLNCGGTNSGEENQNHAEDIRGTRGNGQAALRELESKFLKITNETIRATQEALAATSMKEGQDPDEYINEATRLRELLKETGEPITDRHFMDSLLFYKA